MNPVNIAALKPFDKSRLLGVVSEATSSIIIFELQRYLNINDSSTEVSEVQVGQFLLISCDNFAVFGKVVALAQKENSFHISSKSTTIATVKLLASLDLNIGCVYPGVLTHPRIGDKVYYADSSLVLLFACSQHGLPIESEPIVLRFAQFGPAGDVPLGITPEMLFGRHCALFGSTGSGKSWTIARILEEVAETKGKVILFDATGEFASLTKGVRHVYFGKDPNPPEKALEVGLPYFELTESDLFAIFRPAGQSQGPKLRAAIKSLKLAILAPELTFDGTIVKADKSKEQYETSYRKFYREVEEPTARFNIRKLPRQIENECIKPTRSALEQNIWGDYQGAEVSRCIPLISRIQDIIQSVELAPLFNAHNKPSLFREIDSFLTDKSSRILRISLQFLSFAHNTREIVANAVGRYLLHLARKNRFMNAPLLVVIDEAHQFLNQTFSGETDSFPLDSFALIAKEGRKYALSICLATQRPRDVPESVLSQLNTMIVHRVINDQDRQMIERASSEIDTSSVSVIPSLAPGEAVIVGANFSIPLVVRVAAPSSPPRSKGPDYQKYW